MTQPELGPWAGELSVTRKAIRVLGTLLPLWQVRAEPDARARRCASEAINAIDTAMAALGRIRDQLIAETRRADDEAGARVDAMLSRMREGPPTEAAPAEGRRSPDRTPAKAADLLPPSVAGGERHG
jgi:hypothetical protein